MARQTTGRRPGASGAAIRPRTRPGRAGLPWPWLIVGAVVVLVALGVVLSQRAGGDAGGDAGGAIATLQMVDFHALAFSSDDPNVVFFGHHNGIMRSDDGGHTWRSLVDRRNFDAMGLAVNRGNPRQIYLAGHDIFQVSTDGGASWQPVNSTLPGTDIHGFAMSPDDPNHLTAFVVGQGVFQSADEGKTWQRLGGQVPGDVMGLASAGGAPETLYAGSMSLGLLRSTDGGQTWTSAAAGLGSRNVLTIGVDPTNRQTVYTGLDAGLYKSSDGGTSWSKLPFPGENAVAVAVSPARPSTLLAIEAKQSREGLVFRSEDGGATWGQRPGRSGAK